MSSQEQEPMTHDRGSTPDNFKRYWHISQLVSIISDLDDKVGYVQKAIAGLREQIADFKEEYSEDTTDLKRQLQDLEKNRTWIAREGL